VRNTANAVRPSLPVYSHPLRLTIPNIGQAQLQHYTEPSTEPLPATSSALQGTILPLGPGTFTHNAAGVPIIVVCTKADLIDDNNDLVGAGTSGMGGMVKGKGDEWEERTDGIMQILRTVCLKCTS
jgi:dynein light intermediate chain 1